MLFGLLLFICLVPLVLLGGVVVAVFVADHWLWLLPLLLVFGYGVGGACVWADYRKARRHRTGRP